MKDDLKGLRNKMDKTIYQETKFTRQHKQEVLSRATKASGNQEWIPRSLTAVFLVCFLGLGVYLVSGFSLDKASSDPSPSADNPVPSLEEKQAETSDYPFRSDLPADTALELTDDFMAAVSIPTNLRDVLPEVKSKPLLLAATLKDGYRISASYPTEDGSIELIESVETKERVAEELRIHHEIAPDQQELQLDGNPAFYSEDQKEMHIFTENRYFTVYGAEKELLMQIAELIDLEKPLAPIELQELTMAKWYPVDLSEIGVKNYIPSDFHEKTEFLKDSKPPTPDVLKGEEGSSINNGYISPITSKTVHVEQMYTESGTNKIADRTIDAHDIIRTVELDDRTILLMTDGQNNTGYFEKGQYSFLVTGNKDSIALENVEEILRAIEVD